MNKNNLQRCPWLDLTKPDYIQYHDDEWGIPVRDDKKLFENLTLESAQAGLSWYTVLKKRNEYRKAFSYFDIHEVATYTNNNVEALLNNAGLIRHRGKIESTINNAKRFIDIQKEFGSFSIYLWQFVNNTTIVNTFEKVSDYPTTSPESVALSKDLKKRGFKFVGPTICYAFMQACGLVNDHSIHCYKHNK